MEYIVLDTNIIISYPKLLGIEIHNTHFLVPIDVIFELNNRANTRGKSYDDRVVLIEESAEQGKISIINTNQPGFITYNEMLSYEKLTQSDVNIISTALVYKQKYGITKLATLDTEIKTVALLNNIEVLTNNDIENIIKKFENPSSNLQSKEKINKGLTFAINVLLSSTPLFGDYLKIEKIELPSIQWKIKFFEQKEKVNLIAGIIIGIGATFVAFSIYNNLETITSTVNVWGTIIITVISGISLFVFREKQKLSYGILEFLIGIISIILILSPDHFNFTAMNLNTDLGVKLLGGLYIMVRGQDNIVKSLKDTKTGVWLKKHGIGN